MATTFADRLQKIRKEKGVTQVQLAQAFNVSQGTVGNWETGKREPDLKTIRALADYFDVTVDYLVEGSKSSASLEGSLSGIYLSLAKEAQENNINPEDIRLALEAVRRVREDEKKKK